jgi:hypothetical protein
MCAMLCGYHQLLLSFACLLVLVLLLSLQESSPASSQLS